MNLGRLPFLFAAALALGSALPAWAFVPGGGPKKSDCYVQWQVTSPDVIGNGKNRVDCEDGTACDADGAADGTCTINLSLCAFQTDPNGVCTPQPVTAITGPKKMKVKPKGVTISATLPIAPATPISAATCGAPTTIKIPIGSGRRQPKVILTGLKATSSGRPKADGGDKLTLTCNGTGAVACPANPAGADQPSEVVVTVAAAGTDLDNGRTGSSHNFPTPANTKFQFCLKNCNKTDDAQCDSFFKTGEGTFNEGTFGPPLPLFTAGIPVCVMNRYAATQAEGTARLDTGEINGAIRRDERLPEVRGRQVQQRPEPGEAVHHRWHRHGGGGRDREQGVQPLEGLWTADGPEGGDAEHQPPAHDRHVDARAAPRRQRPDPLRSAAG
jgi:hypothetical protein